MWRSLAAVLLFTATINYATANTCLVEEENKINCGEVGISRSECEARGCCWRPSATHSNSRVPFCYYGDDSVLGYALSDAKETPQGLSGILTLLGSGNSIYGPDISRLQLNLTYETASTVRVKITDPNKQRFEVPEELLPRSLPGQEVSRDYDISYTTSPFTFEVIRKADGKKIFQMDPALIYKDQYIELTTLYEEGSKTFGLGESTRLEHALKLNRTYTLWAADTAADNFYTNLYGSYPFYLQLSKGHAHGGLLVNSHGMDIVLRASTLTFKVIGGVIDLYIFSGSTPLDVTSQYTEVVGKPALMPYWSLGFHNCRWGYTSIQEVEAIVANYSAAGLPLETQWLDIDYMDGYRDFTYSPTSFPLSEVAAFVEKLHSNGQHFVPIVDPGIKIDPGYAPYDEALRDGLFIRDLTGSTLYGAKVWPGSVFFPDFLHPKVEDYWQRQIASFYSMVPVDGLWIDMNEPSNFCNVDGKGQVCNDATDLNCGCHEVDSGNKLDYPPYAIENGEEVGRLGCRTISPSALHYDNLSHYHVHNLYGLSEQRATNKALQAVINKRPFVLSRSSFLSTGRFAAKWTGDNAATWEDLQSSIISIMDFNLFAVPMIGADICGFHQNTNAELCARWIALGAFYPFSRDHNANGAIPQELYRWDSVAESGRKALAVRYQLLPYLYTLFYQDHQEGKPVIRPLWMAFPDDGVTENIDKQFMWGDGLLISPVVEANTTIVQAYFPDGLWYRFGIWSSDDTNDKASFLKGGTWYNIDTPLTAHNVHLRGGRVFPLQGNVMTVRESRTTPFTLVAALCSHGRAEGQLFWDNGEDIHLQHFLTISFQVESDSDQASSSGSFQANATHNSYQDTLPLVDRIILLGSALTTPQKVVLNGVVLPDEQISLQASGRSLIFSNLALSLSSSFVLHWE